MFILECSNLDFPSWERGVILDEVCDWGKFFQNSQPSPVSEEQLSVWRSKCLYPEGDPSGGERGWITDLYSSVNPSQYFWCVLMLESNDLQMQINFVFASTLVKVCLPVGISRKAWQTSKMETPLASNNTKAMKDKF